MRCRSPTHASDGPVFACLSDAGELFDAKVHVRARLSFWDSRSKASDRNSRHSSHE